METSLRQKIIDDEHLKLLSYGYLIDGCITVAYSCFFILHIFIFSFMSSEFEKLHQGLDGQNISPTSFLDIFIYVFGALIILGVLYGVAKIVAYRFIKQRRNRMFVYIIGMPNMIFIPYGTALGIATIIVMGRDSVIKQFE